MLELIPQLSLMQWAGVAVIAAAAGQYAWQRGWIQGFVPGRPFSPKATTADEAVAAFFLLDKFLAVRDEDCGDSLDMIWLHLSAKLREQSK